MARHADYSAQPSATEVRAELERILASRRFQQAGRASNFLRFVVEQTLAGDGQRLKGYTIGIEVFGRPADFDAQSDALVRVEAGRLRRRLVEYYASEGAGDPVRIVLPRGTYTAEYHLAPAAEKAAAATARAAPATPKREPRLLAWPIAAALGALLVAAAGVIAWQHRALNEATLTALTQNEPPRTEWPRLVVVPFENLSASSALDTLAASVTEEILLRLNALDVVVVAGRASWYGPSSNDEKRLDAAAAGGYMLTGSVRGSSEQARIAVRLLEVETGAQLWTAAYDEVLPTELLALQERVARDVVSVVAPYGPIFEAELARARRPAQQPKLRDCLVTYHEYRRRIVAPTYNDVLACYQSVAERQPHVAEVWSGLAMVYVDEYASTFGRTGEEALDAARAATAKALELDRDDFLGNLALTRVQYYDGDPAFRRSIDRTLALRPSSAQAPTQGGFLLVISGDSARGLALIEKARDLSNTRAGPPGLYYLTYAMSLLRERRFNEALAWSQQINGQNWVVAQAIVAAAAAQSGHDDVARDAAKRLRELYPAFEADASANFERWHFDPALHEVLVTGLRAAGLDLEEPSAGRKIVAH